MVGNEIWASLCKNAIETSKRKKKLHGSSCTAAREVLQMEMGSSSLYRSLLRLVIAFMLLL